MCSPMSPGSGAHGQFRVPSLPTPGARQPEHAASTSMRNKGQMLSSRLCLGAPPSALQEQNKKLCFLSLSSGSCQGGGPTAHSPSGGCLAVPSGLLLWAGASSGQDPASASSAGKRSPDCFQAERWAPVPQGDVRLTIVAVNGMLSIREDASAETHTTRTMAAARRRSSGTIWKGQMQH